jgi:integrase/recombinase XerD
MLTIYRRHVKKCEHRPEGRKYRRCRCPIWVDGSINGKEIPRRSLRLQNWEKAQAIIREWEAEGSKPTEPADNRLTVEAAFDQYLADAESRQLGPSAIYKRKLLRKQMIAFATDRGVRHLEEFDLKLLRDFRATWRNRNLSAKKKLEQLRGFFRFWFGAGH